MPPALEFTIDDNNPSEDVLVYVSSFPVATVNDADALVQTTVGASGPGGGGLEMSLISPDGTTVGLSPGVQGSLNQTYDDTTNPPTGGGLLADFMGENVTGNWCFGLSAAREGGNTRCP